MVIQIMRQEKTVIAMVAILTPRKMSFENSTFFFAAAVARICWICSRSFLFSSASCRSCGSGASGSTTASGPVYSSHMVVASYS